MTWLLLRIIGELSDFSSDFDFLFSSFESEFVSICSPSVNLIMRAFSAGDGAVGGAAITGSSGVEWYFSESVPNSRADIVRDIVGSF